jgi:hypothetical protein
MTHAGGQSQAEKRLNEAAAIFKIIRRRKIMYGVLAIASRCLVLMYKVAICHPST